MPRPKPATEEEKQPSFEELVQRVEQIVARLEDGSLGLNESLQQYEAGITCIRRGLQLLDEAERKVVLLTGTDPSGTATVEPFRLEQDMTLAAKADRRSERRSATSRPAAGQDSLFQDL